MTGFLCFLVLTTALFGGGGLTFSSFSRDPSLFLSFYYDGIVAFVCKVRF